MDRPCPANGHHRRPHLALEHISIGHGHKTGPIDEGLGLGSEVGKIGGRADYDPVRCGHLLDALIYHVLVLNAPAVLFLFAFEAGFAASQGAYKVHQLRLNPLALQFPEDRCQ